MKAIVTVAPKQSVVKEIDEPIIHDNGIKVKMKYCGVCHSEHYDWANKAGAYGHEPLGYVVETGKNVTNFKVGDRVSGLWGNTLPGSGAMVEYMVLDEASDLIIKLPDNVRDEDIVVEPLSCMFSAVSKARCSMPGTRVAVVGCGYMGCGAISLLKLRGCYVVAVDIRESARQDALKYGHADEAITPEEALDKYYESFECVMEWAENNESLETAIKLVKMCGQLCVGAYHTGPKRALDMECLGVKAIELLNTHPRERELSEKGAINAVEMLKTGAWDYKGVPTMIYPVSKFDLAQEEMDTKYGHHMKSLIDMEMLDGDPYMV